MRALLSPILRRLGWGLVAPTAVFGIAGLSLLADADNGLLVWLSLGNEVEEARADVVALERERSELDEQADLLGREDPADIERRAREDWGMLRRGERELRWR